MSHPLQPICSAILRIRVKRGTLAVAGIEGTLREA